MDKPVIIIGAGQLGRAILEACKSCGVIVYGFLDDDKDLIGKEIQDTPVLGRTDDDEYLKLIGKKCGAIIASDETSIRKTFVKSLKESRKTVPVNCTHQTATISSSVEMYHGNFINAHAFIGAEVYLGNHCIIGTGAIIDHGARIEDYCQIGAGCVINSGVKIEEGAFIGTGVKVVTGVTIGKGARVGAGSVVIGDVPAKKTVFGYPATEVK